MNAGTLYVVATPIGNLGDMTPRAAETLRSVDIIAAEDTRVTGRLLSHFSIKARQMALHEHNEQEASATLLSALEAGENVALVSDAGTPLVSDPGFRLVQGAREKDLVVSPVPGASAALAAVSVCGLRANRFLFTGFLPARAAARQAAIAALSKSDATIVLYESVHRIAATVADLVATFGPAGRAFLGRELTKLHEQCVTATLEDIAAQLADGRIVQKGEFVLVVEGPDTSADPDAGSTAEIDVDHLLVTLMAALPGKQSAELAASILGRRKNALYERMLVLKERR